MRVSHFQAAVWPRARAGWRRAGLALAITAGVLLAPALAPSVAPALLAPAVTVAQEGWVGVTLADARNNIAFSLRDFEGRVLLVQPMATW